MVPIPEILTHNFDPARGPFRNLCALPPAEAERILTDIRASGQRRIKANYLSRRLAVEDWLLRERRRKLGPPRLDRPIYFFLGDFADGLDPARPASVLLPLAVVSPDMITFTYPDSMASLALGHADADSRHRRAYHGQVFTLAEIKAVVARFGLPGDRWKHEPAWRYDKFIEVQLWDDRPLAAFLRQQSAPCQHSTP